MKKFTLLLIITYLIVLTNIINAQAIIIDHNCAYLEPIPESAILQARDNLHIAYGHTSHGSQLTDGINGLAKQNTNLVGYKGDIYCWDYYPDASSKSNPCIDLHDYFRPGDLGHNGDTQWEIETRDYLENDPNSSDINVVMWSWCGGCSDNTYDGIQTYLETMNQLEEDYPEIKFVYMTGHTDIWADETLKENNQHIRNYCEANNKILFDFADIERYDPDGKSYFEFVNDNCNYYDQDFNEKGNWAINWQNSHTEGIDWYDCSAAHTEPLNGNRKAYATWWMFARLSGWEGLVGIENNVADNFELQVSPNPAHTHCTISYLLNEVSFVNVKIFNTEGKQIKSIVNKIQQPGQYRETLNLNDFPKGAFHCVIVVDGNKNGSETFIVN